MAMEFSVRYQRQIWLVMWFDAVLCLHFSTEDSAQEYGLDKTFQSSYTGFWISKTNFTDLTSVIVPVVGLRGVISNSVYLGTGMPCYLSCGRGCAAVLVIGILLRDPILERASWKYAFGLVALLGDGMVCMSFGWCSAPCGWNICRLWFFGTRPLLVAILYSRTLITSSIVPTTCDCISWWGWHQHCDREGVSEFEGRCSIYSCYELLMDWFAISHGCMNSTVIKAASVGWKLKTY